MKISTFVLGATAQVASAHYFFDTNVVDGVAEAAGKYVRGTTRETAYNPIKFSSNPAEDIRDDSFADGEDIRCNQGAFSTAGSTEVLTVSAGSEVTAKLGVGAKMEHPGPGLVYMSRAPGDDVKAYDGSGDWFKIFEEGVCDTGADFTTDAWCTWGRDTISASIPADTPNGEYLVRFEHIGVHRSHVNQPEHYAACLQVKVVDGGSGTPGPLVQFPGAYTDSDDYANFSIYGGFKEFPMPGPEVWSSGASTPNEPVDPEDEPLPNTPEPEEPNTPEPEEPNTPEPEEPNTPEPEAPNTPEPEAPTTPGSDCSSIFEQCGGSGFTGSRCCASGSCKTVNEWYSQCLPDQRVRKSKVRGSKASKPCKA